MNTYTIYIGSNPIACVSDTERAYACYGAAKTIAEATGRSASLVWDETDEEVAGYDPEEYEDEYEREDPDYEMGFDPYSGCYTDDC